MRRSPFAVLLSTLLVACIAGAPGSAAAFGTIDGAGQRREHERITRAALACTAADAPRDCFEPGSADYLAGHHGTFGAVGAPDNDEISDPAAHCDDADYLAGDYPRTRDVATSALMNCVNHLRTRFEQGLAAAGDLLDDQGRVIAGEVSPDPECSPHENTENRAKCATIEAFGRVLHGVQDFYSHSNFSDQADPSRPLGDENPVGLGLPAPSPVLDLRSGTSPSVPADLSTGCYVLNDRVPGAGPCQLRVTHAALNKDKGLIDPVTGRATDPGTPRGTVGDNFARAVSGAITESRRQWQDFGSELVDRYGRDRGRRMICALTRDDPVHDCRGWTAGSVAAVVLGGGLVLAAAVAFVRLARRRFRPAG